MKNYTILARICLKKIEKLYYISKNMFEKIEKLYYISKNMFEKIENLNEGC